MFPGVTLPTFGSVLEIKRAEPIPGVPLPDCKNMIGSIMRSNVSLQRPDMGGKCDGMHYRESVTRFPETVSF